MKSINISGMGGGYEAACQKMLFQGLRYLKDKPNFDWTGYATYRGVYGLCTAENADAKGLDEAICEGVDPSGAMHQAVISHLAYIHQHGHEAWLEQAKKQGREVIEVDEAQVDREVLIAQIEWELRLARGENPVLNLLKDVPRENWVTIDFQDPESVKRAVEKIGDILTGGSICQ